MIRTAIRNRARSIAQLPWDINAALAANLHAHKPLVEAGDRVANSLMKRKRLYVAQLRLAIVAQHRLAVLVLQRLPRGGAGRVELDPVSGPVAGIENLVYLAR